MNVSRNQLVATAKAAGAATALVLGLALSTGGAAAHVRTAGIDAAPVAHLTHQTEEACEGNEAAVEAALHVATRQLQSAFTTSHLAIEQLREQAGGRDKAARDLLKQADAQVKEIRANAKAELGDAREGAEECTALDTAAIDALVAKAIADMDLVVATVTADVAALPAIEPEAAVEDDDEDDEDDEDEDEDHETRSTEKHGERSATSRSHAKR